MSDRQKAMKRFGVLAMQGAFVEHIAVLEKLGVEAAPVRLPEELKGLAGLILPGGESTTISRLMITYGLTDAIKALAAQGFPLFGTCAGMILLANEAVELDRPSIGIMNIRVRRNAFGRQVDSFQCLLDLPAIGISSFPAIFIRAPLIESVGPGVQVLASIPDGPIVAAQQGNVLVTAFHPELTDDPRLHRYFLDLADSYQPAIKDKDLVHRG